MKKYEDVLCVIPARERSTRFPSKLLAKIDDESVIVKTVGQCLKTGFKTVVATDSEKIADEVERKFQKSVQVFFVKEQVSSGTERVALCVRKMGVKPEIIVNVQGDEPTITPEIIKLTVKELESSRADISTYGFETEDEDEIKNPNRVKVVLNPQGYALYFSRSPVPWGSRKFIIHTGIYAFRYDALFKFVSLPPSENEKTEKLEQLRAIDNGMKIKVVVGKVKTHPVDVPEDIKKVREILNGKR